MVAERKRNKIQEINSSYVRNAEQEVQGKNKKKRIVMARLIVVMVIALVLSAIGVTTIMAQAQTLQDKQQQKLELQAELSQLESEQIKLEQDIENYNDLDYIAEVARRDYFLSKEGEIIFKLPQNTTH
jgi:cell division protein DivIC